MRTLRKRKRNYKVLNGMFSTVRPTSKYPSTYAGFPEDMDDWNCAHWKAYYINNKAIVGKTEASKILEIDIESIGSWASGQLCKYDCAWMDFFNKEGIKGGSIFSKLFCATEGVADVASSGVEAVGGITDFVASVTNNKLIVMGLIGTGIYLYNRNKNG